MRGHGDKGHRDKEAEKKPPPCFTPLWGSPPGGPHTPESPEGRTVVPTPPPPPWATRPADMPPPPWAASPGAPTQPADMPAVAPPAVPPVPPPLSAPAPEQTLSPRIPQPLPPRLRRLKPRELHETHVTEPRLPHAFDVPTPWYLKNRGMKTKPHWIGIIIAIAVGVILVMVNFATDKNKTTTTSTPKSSPAVTAQSANGNTLLVAINGPRENEIVESGIINVTGRVTGYGNQNLSGTTVTVSIKAGHVATGTTDQQGSFSIPIQLLPQNNYMEIQVSLGTRSGSSTRTCFYSCDSETYKAACVPLDYASVLNNVGAYKYERCSFNGRVDSTEFIEGEVAIYMDTAFRDGEWTDPVVVRTGGALTIIPGDIIQVWGELTGQVTVVDVRWLQIEAAYIEPAAR